MVRMAYRLLLLLIAVSLLSPSLQAGAFSPGVQPRREQPIRLSQARVSQDQAAAMARTATGGRILAVTTKGRDGQWVHYVKVLLANGRVRVVRVDANTGQVRK